VSRSVSVHSLLYVAHATGGHGLRHALAITDVLGRRGRLASVIPIQWAILVTSTPSWRDAVVEDQDAAHMEASSNVGYELIGRRRERAVAI
jgi:hypothetical protein